MAATVGAIAAGVALFEVALIPGMVIGGAAVLAPKLLSKYLPNHLPKPRRRVRPLSGATGPRRIDTGVRVPDRPGVTAPLPAPSFGLKRAVVKTITFRIIVTTLDFTTNYVVIGELATAAGLSGFALVVGPLFYFVHEAAWTHFGRSIEHEAGRWGPSIDLPALPLGRDAKAPPAGRGGFTINRAVAKTITFRTIATTIDFTTNYVVVGELATAAALSAVGFVVGPFVYLGHEMAWDRFGSPGERTHGLASADATPAP